jgi:hypothetical protein
MPITLAQYNKSLYNVEIMSEYDFRYEKAISNTADWLARTGRSQSWLANELGVDRSVLGRFLQRDPKYTPKQGRERAIQILEGIERICKAARRTVFLSHSSCDKKIARRIFEAIEREQDSDGENLSAWFDEAEISPGQSIPQAIEHGIGMSECFAILMSPDYFASKSGWTDAEWQSVLHADPSNRQKRFIPLLIKDCPDIPRLLRQFLILDLRGNRFADGLKDFLRWLRKEPAPRSVSLRGELVAAKNPRANEDFELELATPDSIAEALFCNLLPVDRAPKFVWIAPIVSDRTLGKRKSHTKEVLKRLIHEDQARKRIAVWTPAFRVMENWLYTFHDLEHPESALRAIIDTEAIERSETTQLTADLDSRNIVTSLCNMAVQRHLNREKLLSDNGPVQRFFFPPENGKSRVVEWTPSKRRSRRTVTQLYMKSNGTSDGWLHQACSFQMQFFSNKYYLKLEPTRILTVDGCQVRGGKDVGRIVTKWIGKERNIHILYNVRFWSCVLRNRPGPIVIAAGDQTLEISKTPATIRLACGIEHDQCELLDALDQEAEVLAEQELDTEIVDPNELLEMHDDTLVGGTDLE